MSIYIYIYTRFVRLASLRRQILVRIQYLVLGLDVRYGSPRDPQDLYENQSNPVEIHRTQGSQRKLAETAGNAKNSGRIPRDPK
jgi:hypothetical protein